MEFEGGDDDDQSSLKEEKEEGEQSENQDLVLRRRPLCLLGPLTKIFD